MSENDYRKAIIEPLGAWFTVSAGRHIFTDNASGRQIWQTLGLGTFRTQEDAQEVRDAFNAAVDEADAASEARWKSSAA